MAFQETLRLPDGADMPRLGQGTWQMAEDDRRAEREIAGLRHGFALGFRLIDSAEMYADGRSELLVGRALQGYRREDQFIVIWGPTGLISTCCTGGAMPTSARPSPAWKS